ncbi:MAG: 50S ribosomal protein L4 [Leptolyngbyaceae bacterium]|nr:50S ribosomal protein L4 [Leptolyngbyaceae bacterium]
MSTCIVRNWQGDEVGQENLELSVAKEGSSAHVVHRALVRQLNHNRQGTASTKTRSEVRGGGKKPWRQKGTGRARAGSSRSPLWKGGGVTFGPKPRSYREKMNKKERRLALSTAFQGRANDLIVVEDFSAEFARPKTRDLVAALERWGVDPNKKVLLIVAEKVENIYLSARNISTVKLISSSNLNIFDILTADKIVATSAAINHIKESFNG